MEIIRLKGDQIDPLEEASTRFELVHDGFADRSLTAWVRRLKKSPLSFDKLNAEESEALLSERSDLNRRP